MEYQEVMATLQELGTEKTRKIYQKHGAEENLFGVSFADLKNLKKKIKIDQELAEKLWSSGNIDARIFATMIADPKKAEERVLDSWIREIGYHVLLDEFVLNVVSKSAFKDKKLKEWIDSDEELIGRAGWYLLVQQALHEKDLPDCYFEEMLVKIEREIHGSKNRKKEAMNNTLIAIGLRNDNLEEKAIETAGKVGKVCVDHGDTSCKTPNAVEYIKKAKERKKIPVIQQ